MTKSGKATICFVSCVIAALAFLLGWSMRGDKIYGDMFRGTVVAMEQLPAMKGMK